MPVSVLARRAGVSLAHASRSFVRSHGMPPQLLRRELRCRQALALLGGEATLAEVAAASGFSDQSHLNRTLRLTTGATPAQLPVLTWGFCCLLLFSLPLAFAPAALLRTL